MTDPLLLDYDGGLGPAYGAEETRQGDAVIFSGPSAGQVFSGAVGGVVTVVGSTITIQPLAYIINGSSAPGVEGVYRGLFVAGDTANLSKALNAAHATLDRIDSIRVHVYNHNRDGSNRREHVIEYQAGTPASTPVKPTLPASSYELATIFVPYTGAGSPAVTLLAKPPTGMGGARPGTTTGDLEIYDPVSGTWKRVAQTVGAHFMGGYDPGVTSGITVNTWVPLPITATESSSRVTLVGGNSLRIDEAGLYQCDGRVQITGGTASGTIRLAWWVNGVEKREWPIPATTAAMPLSLSCKLRLNAADVLELKVRQETGAGRNFVNGVIYNYMDIARVS